MNMFSRISDAMANEIRSAVLAYQGQPMPVYAVAESIRKRWEDENVALEDIVEQLIREGNGINVSFELDPRQAADALRGAG
jgi:hypothetical protein